MQRENDNSKEYAIRLFEDAYNYSQKAETETENIVGHLQKAVELYEECLQYTPPGLLAAGVQHNIGLLLIKLHQKVGNADYLQTAIEAFRAALIYRTPKEDMEGYIVSQINLALCYEWLAKQENPRTNLLLALEAHMHTLDHSTAEKHLSYYYSEWMNIGNVYHGLARFQGKAENLKAALDAYDKALEFYSPTNYPLGYALVKLNAGLIHKDSGDKNTAAECWREAKHYFEQVGNQEEADRMQRWIDELS